MKKKIVLIPENVYRQPVYLCLGHEWDSPVFQKFLANDMEIPTKDAERIHPRGKTGAKWVINDDNQRSFIWINPKMRAVLPMAVHEIGHLCIYVLESRGVPIKEDSSEAFTYLMEYYSNEVFYHMGLGKMTYYKKK